MLYKNYSALINDKAGISINGVDILDLDPAEVRRFISNMSDTDRKIVEDKLNGTLEESYERMTGRELPRDYAKDYGRPSLDALPYMRSENDGYPYLGNGHAPNCDGKLNYKENIYTKRKICWCMWGSKATSGRYGTKERRKKKLWVMHDSMEPAEFEAYMIRML